MSAGAQAVQCKICLTPAADPEKVVHVLVVSPFEDDHASLRRIFAHSNWRLHASNSCREAEALLDTTPVSVIIAEADLPDGSWKRLLEKARTLPRAPLLTVTAAKASDQLWVEALNLGAYDLLMKPFEFDEVTRVIALASRHWKNRPCEETLWNKPY